MTIIVYVYSVFEDVLCEVQGENIRTDSYMKLFVIVNKKFLQFIGNIIFTITQ